MNEFKSQCQIWRSESNPWYGDVGWHGTNSLILEDDYNAICEFNRNQRDENYKICDDAYPQPYIGNPEAPIWILMLNPSYSIIDQYEMADAVPADEELLRIMQAFHRENERAELAYFRFNERSSPGRRREFLRSQLSFKLDSPFYALEEDFNVWNYAPNNVLHGCYQWWRRMLLGRNRQASAICHGDTRRLRYFFNLEFFPYHSRSFDQRIVNGLARSVKHFEFWKRMIKYAFDSDKIIIHRGSMNFIRDIFPGEYESQCQKNRIIKSTGQCASISNNNLRFVHNNMPIGELLDNIIRQ